MNDGRITRLAPEQPDTRPSLCIVTLCKDDSTGLLLTLRSTQRLREVYPIRHIVLDGSTGLFTEEAKSIADKFPEIAIHWSEPKGTADAINRALAMVSEPWVWFLNSGDVLVDDFDLVLLTEMLAKTTAKVVTYSIIDGNGDSSRRPALPFLWPPVFTWLCIPATIFRVDELRNIGGLDLKFKLANDGEMWFRLLGQRSVTLDIISVPMVRMAPEGLSGDRRNVAIEALAFLKKHRFLILKRWIQSGLRYFEAKRKYRRRLKSDK